MTTQLHTPAFHRMALPRLGSTVVDPVAAARRLYRNGTDPGSHLPRQLTPRRMPQLSSSPAPVNFVGRLDELTWLLAELDPGQVVTICGPGGVGKSALAARAIAHLQRRGTLRERFPDGVLLHSFYTEPRVEMACEQIARAFGREPRPNPVDAARRALVGRRLLLVLDGAEEADDLLELLALRDRCGALVTTRDETQSSAVRMTLSPLAPDEALLLLQSWAQVEADDPAAADADAGEAKSSALSADRDELAGIADLVGRLPLALRLAGRFLQQQPMPADRYRSWLADMDLGRRDLVERGQAAVPLLIERSLAAMTPAASQMLATCGLLALAPVPVDVLDEGMRPLGAAAGGTWRSMMDQVMEQLFAPGQRDGGRGDRTEVALRQLVAHGLLARAERGVAPTHSLIHSHARGLTPPPGTLERLAAVLAERAERESLVAREGHQEQEALRVHLLSVLYGCAANRSWEAVRALAWAVDPFLELHGHRHDRVRVLERGLRASRALAHRRDEGAFLGKLGNAWCVRGELERAVYCYQQALSIARETGDRSEEGLLLGNLGLAHDDLGEVEKAISYHQQALALAQDLGDRKSEGIHMGSLGLACSTLGEAARATDFYQRALAMARACSDRQHEATWLGNLGSVYAEEGACDRAIDCYLQALTIARETGDRQQEGNALGNLGSVYADMDELERAIGFHQQALTIARETGDRGMESAALGNLGEAYARLGHLQRAVNFHRRALVLAQNLGDRRDEAIHSWNLAELYGLRGQYEIAAELMCIRVAYEKEIGHLHADEDARFLAEIQRKALHGRRTPRRPKHFL